MTTEEFTLLRKAAADPRLKSRSSAIRTGAWPSNRTPLFRPCLTGGHVLALGESMGPHIGGTFAIWQITPQGRAILGEPL